jgi:hypothetical protein
MLDVQQGRESYVPSELSVLNLPMSYRFYDSILAVIQENISDERKEYFHHTNKLNYENFK